MSCAELQLEPVAACPLCAGHEAVELDRVIDTLMAEINRYLPAGAARLPPELSNTRRRCVGCGLVYLGPRLDATSLSQVYGLWYGYAYRRVMADPAHVAERLREFERHHLRLLEEHCPERGRLLDVGCGSGLFLQLAQRRGWQVAGIELDPDTAAWGRERGGVHDIRCGTLATTLGEGERFDAITMFDYLEHTPSPGADLDRLAEHLAPGGTLMVRVPNAAGWQARHMGPGWIAVMATHLSYFTPEVLRRALGALGLEVLYARAGNYRTELEILRQRWSWLRQRFARASADAWPAADGPLQPPISDLGGAARRWLHSLWIEQLDHVGGWFGQGNNLTVIARKAVR